jgi:SAM-dependent methyltransferase
VRGSDRKHPVGPRAVDERLYGLLTCPRCGTSPRPHSEICRGCGRSVIGSSGQLDLLDDDSRPEADRFAAQYRALRTREGWADSSGREDPEGGSEQLWKGRLESVSAAAAVLAHGWSPGARPIVADIGSGGGWAARHLKDADVIAFDLLEVSTPPPALGVRADMRKLPLRSASVDAVLYGASMHYAPIADAVSEASRVLRPGGLMVAVDSPIYKDARAQAQAVSRTAAYYSGAGYPELSDHYHPINVVELRSALIASGFEIERLKVASPASRVWLRLGRKASTSLMVARRVGLR